MSITAGAAATGFTIAGLIALAGALGIAVNQNDINSMGESNFKNDLIKKIETKTGRSINEWLTDQMDGAPVSEYSKAVTHANASNEWDKERDKLDRFANQFAESMAGQMDPYRYIREDPTIAATNATAKWDVERDRLNDLANQNAEIIGSQAATGTATPETPKKEDDKDKTVLPAIPTINEDEGTVGETIEQTWSLQDIQKYIEESQAKQWEREDQIRKETQEREDTAYQRAVADMRKAGINPNLMNINPADSGGGITQATGIDTSMLNTRITALSNELIKVLDREFTGDENTQKQITDLIGTLISTYGMYLTFKK